MASRKRSADTSPNTVMANTMVGMISPAAVRMRVRVVEGLAGASRILSWRKRSLPELLRFLC